MQPRILYLSPGLFDKGGVSRYGRYQIAALRQLVGHENVEALSLLSPDGYGFEDSFAVSFSSFGPSRQGKLVFVVAAMAAASKFRPSIVWSGHVHFGPIASLLASATSSKLVENVYGSEVWTDMTWSRRLGLRRSDLIVSDCHFTLDYIVKNSIAKDARGCVHWDCVDLTKFNPGSSGGVLKKYGVSDDPAITVLSLGRITDLTIEYKGFGRLLQVLPSVLATVPVRLIIAGGGEALPALREMVKAAGLTAAVSVIGRVHEGDLPDLYRACDVFSLVTNRGYGMGEGIPLTPLEAAACGKPLIVGNDDGSQEAVEDGVTGFIVNPHDPSALAGALTQLASDASMRQRMGAAGRARMVREHSFERFRSRTAEALALLVR